MNKPFTLRVEFVERFFYSKDGRSAASQLAGDNTVMVSTLADEATQARAIQAAARMLAEQAPEKVEQPPEKLKLATIVCPDCGIMFSIPTIYRDSLIKRRGNVWCPNGHKLHYRGDAERRRRKDLLAIHEAEQQEAREAEKAGELDWRDKLHSVNVDALGQLVLKARGLAAVCPCCDETFTGDFDTLAKHLAVKHDRPDLAALAAAGKIKYAPPDLAAAIIAAASPDYPAVRVVNRRTCCPHCEKTYRYVQGLARHVRRVHKELRLAELLDRGQYILDVKTGDTARPSPRPPADVE